MTRRQRFRLGFRRLVGIWPKSILRRTVTIIVTVIVVLVTTTLTIIQVKPSLAATFADNVMRPIIGNKPTIVIENFFFSVGDQIKQFEYHTFAKPSASSNTAIPITKITKQAPHLQALSLQPIAPMQTAFPALTGEGQWSIVSLPQLHGQEVIAKTFVRPDPVRSYAIVTLVQMNTLALRLHAVAGTAQPGGPIGQPGPGVIPAVDQQGSTLVAAFNGGFQYKDGQYGMTVGTQTYVPLKAGLGTLTIHKNGALGISRYSTPTKIDPTITAVRQNGLLIVDNGQVTPDTLAGGVSVWGLTTTSSSETWRSGIGVTKEGNLVYAVGPSLTASSLATALKASGAIEAIQLDINPFWVRYVFYQPVTPTGFTYDSLLTTMQNGGSAYLHGYNKDFFYLTLAQ